MIAVTLALAVGSVLLVVCGFAWAARREETAIVLAVEGLRAQPLDEASPGVLFAARGRVSGGETVRDPIDDADVVFFEARLLRRDRGQTLWSRTEGRTMQLDDGSARRVTIELVGAEIAIAPREVDTADRLPSERMKALLASVEAELPAEAPTARYAIEHRAVRVGDELTLVGVPRGEPGALRLTSRDPLYLTPEPLEALQRRLRADLGALDVMLKVGLALGIALVLGGIALVVALG